MTAIRHDAASHRYLVDVDGEQAYLEYRIDGERLTILHTVVPSAIGGRGIAGDLVQAVVADARERGLTIVAQCSYAAAWFRRNPEAADLLA